MIAYNKSTMLLGVKSNKEVFLRHLLIAVVSTLLVYTVWRLNSTWSPEMRLWKSFGGAAFFLLWFTLFIGPASRLWRPLTRLVTWRRETGIWFTLVGLVHGYLVLDGWVRWSFWGLLGYRYFPEMNIYLRAEPGFGLANLMGLTAITFALALAATSSDKAVSFFGISSWKWLHTFAYVIFYIIALHVLYFAFIHFSPSPQRLLQGLPTNYPVNKLRFYYLAATLSVSFVQTGSFIKTIYKQRSFGQKKSTLLLQNGILTGIAVLLIVPIIIIFGSMAYISNQLEIQKQADVAKQTPQNYAQSFYLVIKDESQEISLWVKDIDNDPYFRQTIAVDGETTEQQIYRNDEKTLYINKADSTGNLTWSKIENVTLQDVSISSITSGPGVWAAKYGVGDQEIKIGDKTLQVSIKSVNDIIEDDIFSIPKNANLIPVTPQ